MTLVLENRVKEISTTTGTGVLTLSGAMTGFRTFASRCAVGDTFRYTLQGVDSHGVPTGEWEVGIGTYSAANQITRSVLDSSSAGVAVDLSVGTKQIWIGMDAAMGSWIRERLTASRTYYVRTDGSDSNMGLVDSASGAFRTIQKAVDTAASLDLGKYQVTVQVRDGTYTDAVMLPKCQGDLTPVISGNVAAPSNVHVSVTGAHGFQAGTNTFASNGIAWHVQGMKITAPSKSCLYADGVGSFISHSDMVFGVANVHLAADHMGLILGKGACGIAGSAYAHAGTSRGGTVLFANGSSGKFLANVSITSFVSAFGGSTINAVALPPYTMGGFTCTGKQYESTHGSIVIPGAGGFPGTAAGTVSRSGVYWA